MILQKSFVDFMLKKQSLLLSMLKAVLLYIFVQTDKNKIVIL